MKIFKLLVIIFGFIYVLYYANTSLSWHFIDNVDLLFHEAGHVIFMLFGEFMTILGGSVLQILVPLICAGYFLFARQQWEAVVIMIYWTAINLINVSVYAGDALAMRLPLLTGDVDSHDWNQILFRLNLLQSTYLVSNIFFFSAILIAVGALIIGIYSILIWDKENF